MKIESVLFSLGVALFVNLKPSGGSGVSRLGNRGGKSLLKALKSVKRGYKSPPGAFIPFAPRYAATSFSTALNIKADDSLFHEGSDILQYTRGKFPLWSVLSDEDVAPMHHVTRPELDELGQPRLVPSLEHWKTSFENVPEGIFANEYDTQPPIEYMWGCLYKGTTASAFEVLDAVEHEWILTYRRFPVVPVDATCMTKVCDPVLHEATVLKDLEVYPGLTNKLLYYSGAVAVPAVSGKLLADKSGVPSLVRFIITEQVGETLNRYRLRKGGQLSVEVAVKSGIQMIRLLQKMHSLDYIHRDVRPRNFAVSAHSGQLLLVNFQSARRIDAVYDFPEGELTSSSLTTPIDWFRCSPNTSPWEDRNVAPSFRDDVYRSLMSVAMFMHGPNFERFMKDLCLHAKYYGNDPTGSSPHFSPSARPDEYLALKEDKNFFNPGIRSLYGKYIGEKPLELKTLLKDTPMESKQGEVLEHFQQVLNIVRNTAITEHPDYDAIVNHLTEILQLAAAPNENPVSTDIDFFP